MRKNEVLWIFEYRDGDTPIGATLFEGPPEELPDQLPLPHLQEPWHWVIERIEGD